MESSRTSIALCCLCLLALASFVGGCLVCGNSTVSYSEKGAMVSQKTLDQIEPGKTSKVKLLALLGEPTRKKELSDGSELYTYSYVKKTTNNVAVFLVLAMHEDDEKHDSLYFEIEDDVVRKFWRDSSAG